MATQSTTTLLAALTKRTSDLATLISQLQSRVDTLDPENSLRLILSDGVYNNTFNLTTSGMSLTISATGTYTAGNYSEAIVDGRYIKVDDVENFYTLENGDADYDRIDIVYVGRFGVGVVQGTPSATPTDPDLPESTMALYKITVPANETDGSGLTIEDVRVELYAISDFVDDLNDKLSTDQTSPQTIENGIPLIAQNISDYDSAKQITTKEYVDSALSIVSPFRFYLSNDDDTTGYKKAYLNSPVATETTMSFSSVSGRQFLVGFITDILDGLTQINAGVFNLLIDAQQTNMAAKDLYLDYELYGYDGSTETLLFSSDTSNEIPDTRASISIPATVLNTIDLSSYTSLIVKIYANAGTNTIDLDLFVGGNNSIYFAIAGDVYDTQFARKDLSNVSDSDVLSKVTTKADKVSGATAGNLAGLDSNGNLTDSGIAASTVESISSNMTITFTNNTSDSWNDTGETDLAAAIQAKINALPKFLTNGAVLTLQFSDGTYNLNNTITISGFYGNGEIIIKGNSADIGFTTTKSVVLDFTANEKNGLYIHNNYIKISIYYIHFKINATTTHIFGIGVDFCVNICLIVYCNIENTGGTSYGYLVKNSNGSKVREYQCYHIGGYYGHLAYLLATSNILDCDDLTIMPTYGVVSQAGIIFNDISIHQINGATANTRTLNGGQIFQ